eukprot:3425553-Rhodomonas_salina.1
MVKMRLCNERRDVGGEGRCVSMVIILSLDGVRRTGGGRVCRCRCVGGAGCKGRRGGRIGKRTKGGGWLPWCEWLSDFM